MKTGIINKIERLRKEKRITKKKLCEYSNISTNMYSKYLNGSKINHIMLNPNLARSTNIIHSQCARVFQEFE